MTLIQGKLGEADYTILGETGFRLSNLNSFHLDEGPNFAWLNLYRVLANGAILDFTRERKSEFFGVEGDSVKVKWSGTEKCNADASVSYQILEHKTAVDVTFSIMANEDMTACELFIANYFTPYYTPYFAINNTTGITPELDWYQTEWFGEKNYDHAWVRDTKSKEIFTDGRWDHGYGALAWQHGPTYNKPLMIQEHRFGHAIILMAKPEECIGISGFNSYHNSQYFHLIGEDMKTGETKSATIRMHLLTEWDDLKAEALALYSSWITEN